MILCLRVGSQCNMPDNDLCETPQPTQQSVLNRPGKDKFILVLNLPQVLRKQSLADDLINIDPLQISIFGTIVPDVAVPSNEVRFGGQSYNVSSYTRPNYQPLTVNFVVEALEDTAFGSTARTNTGGLQNNSASITLYASYASSESYATLSALVGTKCFIRVKPTSAALSATNPGFELSSTFLSALPVINSSLGELAVYEIELMGGTYTADITP